MAIGPILSIGKEIDLLLLRSRVLRSGGYAVIATTDPGTAATIIRKVEVGLVLLCHSVPEQDAELIRREVRGISAALPVIQLGRAQDATQRCGCVVVTEPEQILCPVDAALQVVRQERIA